MARFDPQDAGFRARSEAVNAHLNQWTLVGASGSWLEAHLMTRAALASGDQRMVGSCVTPAEVLDLIGSQAERCLLVMVDSIAADHGEALVAQLRQLPLPPVIVLMVERKEWLRANTYPIDRVEVVLHTHSFGSGALIQGLSAAGPGAPLCGSRPAQHPHGSPCSPFPFAPKLNWCPPAAGSWRCGRSCWS